MHPTKRFSFGKFSERSCGSMGEVDSKTTNLLFRSEATDLNGSLNCKLYAKTVVTLSTELLS